jgi:branched-chain amino acid transport system substrate-binding protein
MRARRIPIIAIFAALALTAVPASAQKLYDPGASDTEIKIGNISFYTGVFSEYGAGARAEAAYFKMINDRGGINGRKISFVSLDSGSDFRKSLDLARRLVEHDEVLLIFSAQGAGTNLAIREYMNQKKVPQLFASASSSKLNDPSNFPWTMGFQESGRTEAAIFAQYVLLVKPDAKIAVLYANGEAGREYLSGVYDALGDKASSMIVKEIAYDGDAQSIGPHVTALKDSGANVFFNMAAGRYATEAIRAAFDVGWHPMQFIANMSQSTGAFLEPAGYQKSAGIISSARSRGWLNAQARNDPEVRDFLDWMKTYNPEASVRDSANVYGYEAAQVLVEVLKRCGDNLTRSNVLLQAATLDMEVAMLHPGIRVRTSPTDYRPIKQLYLIKFDGRDWVKFSEVIE